MSRQTAPAVLVAAAAIVSAALGFRAAMLASDASSNWESSVRVEVREGASAVRVPLVVFDEAQFAARVAATRFRAEELLRELDGADPSVAPTLLAESTVLMALAEGSGGGSAENAALDVERRLEEERKESVLADEPTPSELEKDGDSTGQRAALAAAATIPAGLAFLLGAAAQAFTRRRRLLVAAGAVALLAAVIAGVAVEVTGA